MKVPKQMKRHCPFCKKHTQHNVSEAKRRTRGSTHPMAAGSKQRVIARQGLGTGNKGRLSRGNRSMTAWKRYGKKQTKKTDFRYSCSTCKKTHTQKKGIRTKKIELK